MGDTRPLNFLWRRATLDGILESYFIKEVLLGGLKRPVRFVALEDNKPVTLEPNTLIGSLGLEMAPLLKEARTRGIPNIGLFHMGDEEGKQDRSFYADADYVIRNYWFPDACAPVRLESLGTIWVPNGYRTGVGPIDPARHLKISERTVGGFFSGAMSGRLLAGQREAMLNAIRAASLPFTFITTPGFGQGLGPTAYAAWLCNARFAPVPAGNAHETIRLYDALETGAIPIMVRSAFVSEKAALGALGEPPLILLNSWDDLAAAYAPYADLNDAKAALVLEERRLQIANWWTAFKQHQQTKVATLIDRAFERNPPR